MIIRRKMPRVSQNRTLGSSGRRALSTGSKLARRMTISRLPDPSAMSSDIAPDSAPQMPAPMPSLFEPLGGSVMAQRGRVPVSDVSTSPTMPKDLQAIYDRHATEDMRSNAGMTSSGFIKDIIQRNKDAQAEQLKGRYTTPRPENVRFEPQKVQRAVDPAPAPTPTSAESDVDFPEQPIFETRRTRSIFEYVNVPSPDKVQPQRAEEPIETPMGEEDLPDALMGSYSLDDYDQPTESIDVSSLYSQETDSPKAEAPQPTTIQRTPDVAEPLADSSLEGLSTDYANTIQRDTSTEINEWSDAEGDMQFAAFEYPTQPSTESEWQDTSDDTPRRGGSNTTAADGPVAPLVQRRSADAPTSPAPAPDAPASTTSIQRQVADSPTSQPPATPMDSVKPSAVQYQTESDDTGTTSAYVQRRLEQSSDVAPSNSIQRTPTMQNIQRDVDAEIEEWQSEHTSFDEAPFTYAASSAFNTENDGDIIDTAESRPARTSQPSVGNVQREPSSVDTEGTSLADPEAPSQASRVASSLPMDSQPAATSSPVIQRSPDSASTPSDNMPTRRDVTTPSQIQRDVEDEIDQWQADTPDFDGEGFFYEPPSSTSNDGPSVPSTVQRSNRPASWSDDSDWTDEQADGVSSSFGTPSSIATTQPTVQRSIDSGTSPATSAQQNTVQRSTDPSTSPAPSSGQESTVQRSTLSSTPAVSQQPTVQRTNDGDDFAGFGDVTDSVGVQRVAGPTSPQMVQRSVDDEIGTWQAQSTGFEADPLVYHDAEPAYEDTADSDFGTGIMSQSRSAMGSSDSSSGGRVQRSTSNEPASKPTIRRATDPEANPQVPSVGVTRVSHPDTSQHTASNPAGFIQRDVANEISTWQQNSTSTASFADESPDWGYASTGVEPTALGSADSGMGIQRVTDPHAASQSYGTSFTGNDLSTSANERSGTDFEAFVYAPDPDLPSVSAQRDEIPLAQALSDAGFFTAQPSTPGSTPSIQRKPASSGDHSLYGELLGLMRMPTDTPVADGPSVTVGVNPTTVQRSLEPATIQREDETDVSGNDPSEDLSGHDNSGKEAAAEGKSPDQQVDQMAEKVYSILNRRFRIEFQRKHGR